MLTFTFHKHDDTASGRPGSPILDSIISELLDGGDETSSSLVGAVVSARWSLACAARTPGMEEESSRYNRKWWKIGVPVAAPRIKWGAD